MIKHIMLKLNLAGKGYSHIWVDGSNRLDLITTDRLLPSPATASPLPLAYSAARLSKNSLFVAVGAYWPDHQDEFGRPGLYAWLGILYDLAQFDDNQVLVVSDLLINLVNRFSVGYVEVGEAIAKLAVEPHVDDDWTAPFVRMCGEGPQKITENAKQIIRAFWLNYDHISERANILVAFPFHAYLALPCLLGAMLYRSDVRQVAGGMLAPASVNQFKLVSTSLDVSGYQAISVGGLVTVAAYPRKRPMTSVTQRLRQATRPLSVRIALPILLLIAIVCVGGVATFKGLLLRPTPTPMPTSTSTPTHTPIPTSTATVTPMPTPTPELQLLDDFEAEMLNEDSWSLFPLSMDTQPPISQADGRLEFDWSAKEPGARVGLSHRAREAPICAAQVVLGLEGYSGPTYGGIALRVAEGEPPGEGEDSDDYSYDEVLLSSDCEVTLALYNESSEEYRLIRTLSCHELSTEQVEGELLSNVRVAFERKGDGLNHFFVNGIELGQAELAGESRLFQVYTYIEKEGSIRAYIEEASIRYCD